MESDDDDFLVSNQPHAPNTATERRRAQRATFEAWLTSDIGVEAIRTKAEAQVAKQSNHADEQLSIKSLLQKQGTEIIKNPRQYQRELFERAKTENTIAVLDTGSGKTLIAVLLVRHVIDQELEHRVAGRIPRVSFFLVASVPLVYQQYQVLETNLDHKIARVCGADNTDNWTIATWKSLFEDHKVIVCTAEILHQCLARSYIHMRQINLLVFDEAHHAKKNHPYAMIVKDFYLKMDADARPRVFSMTASPVDAKTDVRQAASELETLLDSRIATTDDMSLTDAVQRPDEAVLRYDALPLAWETSLIRDVKNLYGHISVLRPVLETAVRITRELGAWCADQYLISAFRDKNQRRFEEKASKTYYQSPTVDGGVKELDDRHAEIQSAFEYVAQKSRNRRPIESADLNSKVFQLKRHLSQQFERESERRCIVFVDQRYTARLLDALFKNIGEKHMRSAFLVGSGSDEAEGGTTHRQQVITLLNFRKGEANCLFATSVAEEGLDISDCNLVIRFDMYKTMIQYVQSRGRARKKNSRFIHMIERGNSIEEELHRRVRYQEVSMRHFCRALPEDRRLFGNENVLAELAEKEKTRRVYVIPETGAKLTYGNALSHLAIFAASLPADEHEPMHPTYIIFPRGNKFMAEVLLPGRSSPIRSAVSRICQRKALAKCDAAFEACIALIKKGDIDHHLMPAHRKRRHAMANALLAVKSKKKHAYAMRTKPSLWANGRGNMPSELWLTVVDFSHGLERQHQPLAFLTRTRMPDFPKFPVYLNDGRENGVITAGFERPIRVTGSVLDQFSAFTWRVFDDVFSKQFKDDNLQLSYWLAPAVVTASDCDRQDPNAAIDWSLLDTVSQHGEFKWTPDMPEDTLTDKFFVDIWDGSRKLYSIVIDHALCPRDPVPKGSARGKWEANILEYSVSLWKAARVLRTWNTEQPVVKCEKISNRLNRLTMPSEAEINVQTQAYVCPEPFRISVLPTTVVVSCFLWPVIVFRLESYLIAMEACESLGITCEPAVALAAVTKDSDNSANHDVVEQINFQSGMGENYERLEFIGDTFLKTATTISTFIRNPNDDEYDFHVKRMLMLCNKNLLRVSKERGLCEFIRSMAFTRRGWYPEGLTLIKGKSAEPSIRHGLADKTIADVSEALIGAAFVTHDRAGKTWKEGDWCDAVRAVTALVGSEDHVMETWNDYRLAYEKPAYQTAETTASQRDLAEKVQAEHPYTFQYPRLLRSAFVHPSEPYMQERIPNYQRLEFLGDALLDMASITYLFNKFPTKDPQWLTEHKMAMVSNRFLAVVCVNAGFHRHLRYSSSILESQIREYATELAEAQKTAGGHRDYWTTLSDPPKCLPDIVEAFVGAMFIDSDFDYNTVLDFFNRHMIWYFEDMAIYDSFANSHPCTHLHNLLQGSYGCQDYRLMAKDLPVDGVDEGVVVAAVVVHEQVVAHSTGKSGRYARIRAAQDAIEAVEGLAPCEYRARFRCACNAPKDDAGAISMDTAGI